MDRPKDHIDIFWSKEDDGYIANVPDLRYCSAFGETPEDALREVLVAMELHLDTLDELGRPVRAPVHSLLQHPHQEKGSDAAHHGGRRRHPREPTVPGAHREQPEEGAGQGARDRSQKQETAHLSAGRACGRPRAGRRGSR
jgi:predicted RNase H-like HicB family nuclease